MTEADPSGSLAGRTIKGAGWLMAWRLASRLLGTVNTVVLLRLLVPSDFGLVALATSFSFAIDGLSYLGVQEALVREPALEGALYDTGFTMTVLRGGGTALIIAMLAWPAAHFFGDPRLAGIFILLALGIFLTSLENIGTVDFQRDLAFGRQVQILMVPRILGIAASITVAVIWQSYWALVAGVLVTRSARLALTYIVHAYRPHLTLRAWRRLIGFSVWSWALSMTAMIQARVDTIVIGGYLNPTKVGLYAMGSEIGGLASSELLDPITRALFAGFASARRAGDGIAPAYLRAISLVALVVLPANAGVALIAEPMTHLVFGPRWADAVKLIQVFACLGVFQVGASISATLLMAEGVPHLRFRIELALTVLRVIGLLALVPVFGLAGAAGAVAATGLIEEVVYLVVTFRRVGLRPRDLASNLWRPFLATAAMASVLLAAGLTQSVAGSSAAHGGVRLALTVLLGALTYGATLLLAWLASGRPRGAETYFLGAATRAIRQRLGSARRGAVS